MKVIYVVNERQWYTTVAVDEYKSRTVCSRDMALRAIEQGWPYERED